MPDQYATATKMSTMARTITVARENIRHLESRLVRYEEQVEMIDFLVQAVNELRDLVAEQSEKIKDLTDEVFEP